MDIKRYIADKKNYINYKNSIEKEDQRFSSWLKKQQNIVKDISNEKLFENYKYYDYMYDEYSSSKNNSFTFSFNTYFILFITCIINILTKPNLVGSQLNSLLDLLTWMICICFIYEFFSISLKNLYYQHTIHMCKFYKQMLEIYKKEYNYRIEIGKYNYSCYIKE